MKHVPILPTLLSGFLGTAALADFSSIDTNDDGRLTQDEIEAQLASDFQAQDTNGDGSVSAEEFLIWADIEVTDRSLEQATSVLNRIDDDEDGKIEWPDVEDRADRIASAPSEIDTDRDGNVSEAERDAARQEIEDGADVVREEADAKRDEARRDIEKAASDLRDRIEAQERP
jgi:Ca2+-binding EF-hand superfamily protein